MNEEYKHDELWIVIVNKNEYELNKEQASVLKSAIEMGTKFCHFKKFTINVSYLEEFYFVKKFLKPEYQLDKQSVFREEEQGELLPPEEAIKKIAEIRAVLIHQMSMRTSKNTVTESNKKRNEVLNQLEKIK